MSDDDPLGELLPGARWLRTAAAQRARWTPRPLRLPLPPRRHAGVSQKAVIESRARVQQARGDARSSPIVPDLAPSSEHADTVPRRAAMLEPAVQNRVEDYLGVRLPPIEIHASREADMAVRRASADALAAGNAIYVRDNAFRPETQEGMGLLVHEATHLAWERGARPVTAPGAPAIGEEDLALANEARLRMGRESVEVTTPPAAQLAPPAPRDPPPSARAAAADRPLDRAEIAPPPQLSDAAVRALKTEIHRALLDTLRAEFERGG